MHKVGDFWVPDIDMRWFRNRRKTLANFADGGMGRDIGNIDGALRTMTATIGAPAMAAASAIDVGANVGAYARRMAGCFGQVHALEPVPETYDCLARNVADWGLTDVIVPHAKAASSQRESVRMGGGGFWRRSVAREIAGAGDIPAVPLDDLGITHMLFLKLDVEGYELKALEGATGLIERNRPFVMMEVKERHLASGRVDLRPHAFLIRRGYRIVGRYGDPVIDRLYAPEERVPPEHGQGD